MAKRKKRSMLDQYDRLAVIEIEDVFEQMKAGHQTMVAHGEMFKLSSLRLQTFLVKGISCSACEIEGSYFAIERNGNPSYHINLWAIREDGEHVLMTHDHTLARGLGGKDNINNTTTMCSPCNTRKSKEEGRLAALRSQELVM